MSTYIYIDDSGSSGTASPSKHIDDSRAIWAAIILSSEEKFEIEEKIKRKLYEVNEENKMNLKEFHFTNIYSKKNEYKIVSAEVRLEIINWFANLYNEYTPYILINACDKNTLKNSGFSEKIYDFSLDGFRFGNPKDFSLWCLLLNCEEYLRKNQEIYQLPAQIYIDAGRQKEGTTQKVSSISNVLENGEIIYCSSNDFLIQFADFIVFTLNRIQNNLVKKRSDFDAAFLEIVGQIKWNANARTVAINHSELNDYGVVEYDRAVSIIENETSKVSKEEVRYIEELCKKLVEIREFLRD